MFEELPCHDRLGDCDSAYRYERNDQDVVVPEMLAYSPSVPHYEVRKGYEAYEEGSFCFRQAKKDRLLQLRRKYASSDDHAGIAPDEAVDVVQQLQACVAQQLHSNSHPHLRAEIKPRKFSRPRRIDNSLPSLHETAVDESISTLEVPMSVRSNPLPKAKAKASKVVTDMPNDSATKSSSSTLPLPKEDSVFIGQIKGEGLPVHDEADGKAARDADEEEDWGVGSVRVLIVCGSQGNDEKDKSQDLLEQLRQWCQLCKVDEVDTVLLPQDAAGGSRLLADALTALGAKSQSGDVCVLILAELMSTQLFLNGGSGVQAMASRHLFLSTLPPRLTVVCISDSASTLESIGLGASTLAASWDANLRAIVMSLAFEEAAADRGSLLLQTLHHMKRSLSLAEGPCGLTCAAFFEELTDQAFDIAAKASLSPPALSMHAHPSEKLPSIVRWPVAALPLNGARRRGRSASRGPPQNLSSPTDRAEEKQDAPRKFFNLAKVVACTEALPDDATTVPDALASQESSPSKPSRKSKESGDSSRSKSRRKHSEGASSHRRKRGSSNAPTNIDQFSAMFSGGLLNKATRDTRETM